MNFRNTIVGIATGLVLLALIKRDDAPMSDAPSSLTATATVAKVESVRSDSVTTTNVATSAKEPTNDPANESVKAGPLTPDLDRQTFPSKYSFPNKPGRLKELLRESIAAARVSRPTQVEIDEFERLFLVTLQNKTVGDQLQLDWSTLGWVIERWQDGGEKFLAVHEASDQRSGRGFYVARVGSKSSNALQAPHRFYDTETGLLTRKLFEENDVVAAAWNTVHRDQVDLAHRSDHFINAMTRALIKSDAKIVVVQVHGFANEKQTGSARTASMITSDATPYPGRLVQQASAELKESFGAEAVRLYPTEVSELGGTLNQQARVFHNIGRQGFLHVELNRAMRAKLTSDASVRAQFFSALTSAGSNRKESRDR